jgi:hypothetical protein
MPIRNKDGTLYKISTPNPLMKNQEIKEEWYTVHNFDTPNNETLVYDEPVKPVKLPDPAPEAKREAPVPIPEPPVPPPVEEKKEVIPQEDKLLCHCLPAKLIEVKDAVYDEVRMKLTYGEKFRFEAVPVRLSDMGYTLWTNIMIENGSIIYSSEDGRQGRGV